MREINSGIFAFDGAFLAEALGRITNDNAKGEYYLTDVVRIAHAARAARWGRTCADDVMQTEGANDRAQLAALGAELNRRILDRWMRDGVTVMDPRDHVGRRGRGAGARRDRCCPGCSCSARPSSRRTPSSARTAP